MRSNASRCAAPAAAELVATFIPSLTIARAGPDELAVDFDHAGVAGLDRAKLRVIADLRQLDAGAIDDIDQAFPRGDVSPLAIQNDLAHAQLHLSRPRRRNPAGGAARTQYNPQPTSEGRAKSPHSRRHPAVPQSVPPRAKSSSRGSIPCQRDQFDSTDTVRR